MQGNKRTKIIGSYNVWAIFHAFWLLFFSRKVRGGGDAKSSYISSAVSHLNYWNAQHSYLGQHYRLVISKTWKFVQQNILSIYYISFFSFVNLKKMLHKLILKSTRNSWTLNCPNSPNLRFCFMKSNKRRTLLEKLWQWWWLGKKKRFPDWTLWLSLIRQKKSIS